MYFICLAIPDPISSLIRSVQSQIHTQFGVGKVLNSPPHITLIPPYRSDEADQWVEMIQEFTHKATPVRQVRLIEIDSFGDRVIYISVEQHQALYDLSQEMRSVMKEWISVDLNRPLIPHVSLATRIPSQPMYRAILNTIEGKWKATDIDLTDLLILKHNGQQWDEYKRITLHS